VTSEIKYVIFESVTLFREQARSFFLNKLLYEALPCKREYAVISNFFEIRFALLIQKYKKYFVIKNKKYFVRMIQGRLQSNKKIKVISEAICFTK